MNAKPKLSLAFFIAAIFVTVLITGWAAWQTYCTLRSLQNIKSLLLSQKQHDALDLASKVQTSLTDMNQALHRAALTGDATAAARFQKQRQELTTWLDHYKATRRQVRMISFQPVTFSLDGGKMLENILQAFAAYGKAADQLLQTSPPDLKTVDQLARLDEFNRQSERLRAFAARVRAQAEMLDLGTVAGGTTLRRQLLLFIGLTVLGLLCGSLAIYTRSRELGVLHRTLRSQEAALERQQKLAHFGELAAGLAHEIRNPLTAINARLFTLELSMPANGSKREDAAVIRREIERLDRIVTDFLKLARPAQPTFVSLNAITIFREVVDLLGPMLAKRSVQLQVGETVHDHFRGDPSQLKQVLLNLVQNAADSCMNNGQVILRARRDRTRLNGTDQNAVVLEVQDNGRGIPPEMQDQLFEPFFSTKKDGTGLGLAISARIIDKHHGVIDYKTEAGRGTTFRVVLPVEEGVVV